jgi:hypothetical protein
MHIDHTLTPAALTPALDRFWRLSAAKIDAIASTHDPAGGSPVFTRAGRYTSRGWTEWTEGFQHGSAILQYDATGDTRFLDLGRTATVARMAPHLSHFGVHDHGFNNLSTYGNLLRLMHEGSIAGNDWERAYYTLALKLSGTVQARRWTTIADGGGFIHSFNGPHSLFIDTIRSCRSLLVAHALGHRMLGENDEPVSLLGRALRHAQTTARYSVFYGDGRDRYDEWGRVAHECVFNVTDGRYRCPNSQQGFSGFTTWTRGLAWAMLGFAELLEYLPGAGESELQPFGGRAALTAMFLRAARATCDWYIANTAADGIPYWDGGAPNLHRLGDYRARPAEPYNDFEPVDSSAAAIAAQALLRLGRLLGLGDADGKRYFQAGLSVLHTLLDAPYLATDPQHQGLILHSVYHHPNAWDHIPEGRRIPCGESSMWGDYHAREAALLVGRLAAGQSWCTFFGCVAQPATGGAA